MPVTYTLPPRHLADPDAVTPDELATADPDAFWDARPVLATIRDVARDRLVSPWAVLGALLATVCTRIGPHVVLPGIVGSVASLNTFWAAVGASGGGKDAALAVARELLNIDDDIPTHEVGTGQGIDSSYTTPTKKHGPIQFCDSALFTITEIDTLAGHARMNGSTVMATLRKVYSGSALGARYADKDRRRPVRAHHYRAAVIAGVQPARAGVLLDDADGGTPQRWIWLPTNDPGWRAWREAHPGEVPIPPEPLWRRYAYLEALGEQDTEELTEDVHIRPRLEVKVCDSARNAVIDARAARLSADLTAAPDDLTGHALLTRLKVAALLGILDSGRAEITEDDWALSGAVMVVSDATRDICSGALAESARRANAARGRQAAEQDDAKAEYAERRIAAALLRTLVRHEGAWVGRKELRGGLRSSDRQLFDAAMGRLVAAGQAEAETGVADSMGRQVDGSRFRAVR